MNAIAIAGAVVFAGLAPSFLDWTEHPEKRNQIVLYYGITVALVIYGLRRTS